MVARRLSGLTALAIGASCASNARLAIPVGVILDGDRAQIGELPKLDGLALHEVALPAPPVVVADRAVAAAAVTRARTAYAAGNLGECRTILRDVDLPRVLAAGDRVLAARALAFDAACAWGAAQKVDTANDAAKFAAYELEIPEAAVPPDVEEQIGAAIAASGSAQTSVVAVTGQVGARLRIDGRADGCALPCSTPPLKPGAHVLAVEADGAEPQAVVVETPAVGHIAIAQPIASPALAAQQWRARQGRGMPAADATGAILMARFGGDRRLIWLHGDASIEGSLVVDGVIAAHAIGKPGETSTIVRALAYDGHVLERPPLYERPWVLLTATAVVVAAAIAVVAIEYTPPKNTDGGF